MVTLVIEATITGGKFTRRCSPRGITCGRSKSRLFRALASSPYEMLHWRLGTYLRWLFARNKLYRLTIIILEEALWYCDKSPLLVWNASVVRKYTVGSRGLTSRYFVLDISLATSTYGRTGRQGFPEIGDYLCILHKLVVQDSTSILQGRKVHRCRPWLLRCAMCQRMVFLR